MEFGTENKKIIVKMSTEEGEAMWNAAGNAAIYVHELKLGSDKWSTEKAAKMQQAIRLMCELCNGLCAELYKDQ